MRTRGSVFVVLAVSVVTLALASPAAALTPNDPSWGLAWGQRLVDMPAAWDITTGNPNVIVAAIDTGVDPTVPDLQGALVPGWDFLNNTWTSEDLHGHGTLTATIIVGRGNDGEGVAGYCWRCRLMPIRASSNGASFDATLTANGINWAVAHGARIISMGFNDEGLGPANPEIAAAIAAAAAKNVFVVASAGNSYGSAPTHPAADPGAFAVASTDPVDALFPWSTFGSWVPVAAPGCQMGIGVGIWAGAGAWSACGTSVSAPAVAGIAALMLSVNPSLTPAQIGSALEQTATPVPGIAGGRVDAYRALLAVGGKPPVPPPSPPPPPPPPLPWQPPKTPGPKMTTRIQRGVLRTHWHLLINVQHGRVAAALNSPKAQSCTLSLKSADEADAWLSNARKRHLVTLSATVPAGKYAVDVWCSARTPRKSALTLRAIFSK